MVVNDATVTLRASQDEDVEAMLAIYRAHIARGVDHAFMHDSEPLQPDDFKRRRRNMRKHRLPHIVAERDGVLVGYAYAVPFRKRPAYRYTLKHSIYVHPEHLHSGIGRALLPALIDACAAAGYRQMIGYIDGANTPSIQLHETCGFAKVGYLPSVGYKFGHWTDVLMLQRSLREARHRRRFGWRRRLTWNSRIAPSLGSLKSRKSMDVHSFEAKVPCRDGGV